MGYQEIALYLVSTLVGYGAFVLAKLLYEQWTSPLRILPGPPSASVIYGNMKQIFNAVSPPCRWCSSQS